MYSSNNPFHVFREAVRIVDRNFSALFLFWAVILPVGALSVWYDTGTGDPQPLFRSWSDTAATLGFTFLDALATAIGASVAFSRIARNIDKPIWRIDTDKEALQRFFPLWFVLSLILSTISLFTAFMAENVEDPGLQFALLLFYVFSASAMIPIGACFMFYGSIPRDNLEEALRPLLNQIAGVGFFILFGILAYIFLLGLVGSIPPHLAYAKLAVHLIGVYCDCVVFSGTWLLYKLDRETPHNEDDFEF